MPNTLRAILAVVSITVLFLHLSHAQPRKGEFVSAGIGLGITSPDDLTDIAASGFYTQGEYIFAFTRWFGVRPYAGLMLNNTDTEIGDPNLSEYRISSKALMFGGKIRVAAPIPWVAPYIEIGMGASIGSFETYTPYTNIKKNGLQPHVPFAFGLAIGHKNEVDFGFTFYSIPSAEQIASAMELGFTFRVD